VLDALTLELGLDLGVGGDARALSRMLFESVPFYAGLTLEEIGGRGVRWQEREAARAFPAADAAALAGAPLELGGESERELAAPPRDPSPDRRGPSPDRQAAGYRSLWDAPEVEHSPSLEFLFRARELV